MLRHLREVDPQHVAAPRVDFDLAYDRHPGAL
jgi:hypothetical protein